MVAPTQEYEVEDIDVVVPDTTGEFETIPPGMYNARLVKFKRVPKPDWKLKGDEETEDDRHQFEFGFLIDEGDWAGVTLTDYTNISWHPKATAHKHAAALLGVPELTPDVALSTHSLAGKRCQIWVTEKPTKRDPKVMRNWIDKVTPMPTPRMRPQRPQNAPQPPGPSVQLPDYPQDADEEDIAF